ncbi:hypothetical protein V5O48_001288 [Marasmius crinis-equi]|uniref:Probable acetate kinase n=1 Tax=Marasmius crinis-equi TaxID=585013 RepID=A0ABR3FZJ2_9AGAR
MAKLVLSVNAGSSSLKISLYSITRPYKDTEPAQLLLTSTISNISSPPASFSFKPTNGTNGINNASVDSIHDHASAFSHFIHHLQSEQADQIVHICHRIVHGGDYHDPVVISDETYHHIETLSDLAPLHNGAALAVIKACLKDLPNANSIAFFDTAFHRTIPHHIASYAIDQTVAKKRGLKKYGFHGLSYAFILRSVSHFLSKPPTELNLIILHLGSGASICAIKHGQSYDTSMGLTPVSGLPGATRSGAIDPSLIFHYTNKAGRITHDPGAATNLHVTQAERILNSQSGWKALAGTTNFAEITARDDPEKKLAFDLFVDRILNYVGSYHLKLRGEVDAIVFAGGIGEKSAELRSVVGKELEFVGFPKVDEDRNRGVDKMEGVVVDIALGTEGKRILVCRTDEQFEMARECAVKDEFWTE